MPSMIIGESPTNVSANNDKSLLCQNVGDYSIYISEQSNVSADGTYIIIPPGTPFTWNAGIPLYAVCAIGTKSRLTFTATGATMGNSSLALTSTNQPQYLPAPDPNTIYDSVYNHFAGIYTITCPATTIATLIFSYLGVIIGTAVTVAGTVVYNLPTQCDLIEYYTDTGSNVQIVLQLTGSHLPYVSGIFTLDISALDGSNTLL